MANTKSSPVKNLIFLAGVIAILALYFKNSKGGIPFFSQAPVEERDSDGNISPKESASSGTDDQVLDQSIHKLNIYTECVNRHSDRAFDSYYRYLLWADRDAGPTGKERNIYGLYTLYDPQPYEKKFEEAYAMAPEWKELDAEAQTYLQSLIRLGQKVSEAHQYYDHKDYQDDGFAKGQQMHLPLLKAFEDFAAADLAFRTSIHAQYQTTRSNFLNEHSGDSLLNSLFQTMALAGEIRKVGMVRSSAEIDAAAFSQMIDNYTASVEEFSRYRNTKPSRYGSDLSRFVDKHDDFLKAAKELMRRARDQKDYSRGETMNDNRMSGWMIDGSPQALLREYQQLISDFNRLRFDTPIPMMLEGTLFHVRGPA